MARRSYVQRKVGGKWTLVERTGPGRRRGPHWQVMPDVPDFVSPVSNTVISGRAQRREHNERYGCEDVGNDRAILEPNHPQTESTIHEALEAALDHHGATG